MSVPPSMSVPVVVMVIVVVPSPIEIGALAPANVAISASARALIVKAAGTPVTAVVCETVKPRSACCEWEEIRLVTAATVVTPLASTVSECSPSERTILPSIAATSASVNAV